MRLSDDRRLDTRGDNPGQFRASEFCAGFIGLLIERPRGTTAGSAQLVHAGVEISVSTAKGLAEVVRDPGRRFVNTGFERVGNGAHTRSGGLRHPFAKRRCCASRPRHVQDCLAPPLGGSAVEFGQYVLRGQVVAFQRASDRICAPRPGHAARDAPGHVSSTKQGRSGDTAQGATNGRRGQSVVQTLTAAETAERAASGADCRRAGDAWSRNRR